MNPVDPKPIKPAERGMLARAVVLTVFLIAAWLLWSGFFKPLILALGAFSVVIVMIGITAAVVVCSTFFFLSGEEQQKFESTVSGNAMSDPHDANRAQEGSHFLPIPVRPTRLCDCRKSPILPTSVSHNSMKAEVAEALLSLLVASRSAT